METNPAKERLQNLQPEDLDYYLAGPGAKPAKRTAQQQLEELDAWLLRPVSELPKISVRDCNTLAEMGVETVGQLLQCCPRSETICDRLSASSDTGRCPCRDLIARRSGPEAAAAYRPIRLLDGSNLGEKTRDGLIRALRKVGFNLVENLGDHPDDR